MCVCGGGGGVDMSSGVNDVIIFVNFRRMKVYKNTNHINY